MVMTCLSSPAFCKIFDSEFCDAKGDHCNTLELLDVQKAMPGWMIETLRVHIDGEADTDIDIMISCKQHQVFDICTKRMEEIDVNAETIPKGHLISYKTWDYSCSPASR